MNYIIELAPQTWLAPWWGFPGMAVKVENAKRFESRDKAREALKEANEACKYGSFLNAKIKRYRSDYALESGT
jgi:hypothetical protein